jgi:molecular chaperone IbpA
MRTYDLSPLMRATVGFDRLTSLLDTASRVDEATLGYPPYNIEKTGEETYRITMAVAGFGEADLDVTVQENSLLIKAGKAKLEADKGVRYLHRGIATRAFERRFDLADHIQVTGARLENGMLSIELEREVPEAMKPRTIAVETKDKPKVIENAAA